MTLYHHSEVPYAIAAEQAGQWARDKFDAQIQKGRVEGEHTIKMLMDNQPQNNFVWHNDLDFFTDERQLRVREKDSETSFGMHRNAVTQACKKDWAGIPTAYVNRMMEDGQQDLLAANFNRRFHDLKPYKDGSLRRFNLRSVHDEVRGFVSDRFPLWDTNILVEEFMKSVRKHGGIIVSATWSDLRFTIKTVMELMFEPLPGEVMLFGASFKTSDFGVGKVEVSRMVDRLVCTNLLVAGTMLGKKHIGHRYDAEDETYSLRTYNKQTEAIASKVDDLVGSYLNPANLETQLNVIREAGTEKVDSDSIITALKERNRLTKEECEKVKTIHNEADITRLPAGQNRWRLGNALAILAQQSEPDRAMHLETVAGEVCGLMGSRDVVES